VQRTDPKIVEYFNDNGISGAGALHLCLFYVSFFLQTVSLLWSLAGGTTGFDHPALAFIFVFL
jgi:hypothetical protein